MLRQSGAHHRKQGNSRKRVSKPERHDSLGLQRNYKESDASHGRDEREGCTTYPGDGRGGCTTYPGDYPYPSHYYGGRPKVDQFYYDPDFDYGGIYETPKGDPRSYEAWSMYPPESTNPYDGRPAVEHTSVEKHTSSTNPSTSSRRGRGRAALAKSKPTATVPKEKKVVAMASQITKSSKKRQTDDEILRQNPGILTIENADPSRRALEARAKLLKFHDRNPSDGLPFRAEHILFAWLPNAAWVGNTLSGYVFSVDGSSKPVSMSTRGGLMENPHTPVVPDMFPIDKMMYGMLCIRLPNTKVNKLGLNPIDSLELYPEKSMDEMLRTILKDGEDLSSESSYAGFYISEDPTREWERTGWIVVSTGDIDISRTIYEYLKGDYNPEHLAKSGENMKDILEDMKQTLERVKKASKNLTSASSDNIHDKSFASEEDDEEKEESVDNAMFSRRASQSASKDSKPEKKKNRKKKRRFKEKKKKNKKHDEEDDETEKGTTERLEAHLGIIPEEDRCAWKYAKLIKEVHRLIRAHADNMASKYAGTEKESYLPAELNMYEKEPDCVLHRRMTWENNLMKESFLEKMLLRMKQKRWLVASKLAGILGFDLIQDFQINPFDKNIDQHSNVIHVTINTFMHHRRAAKMVYYSGAFCKQDMHGGLPVPISPLQGIHILKGPPSSPQGKSTRRITQSSTDGGFTISSRRFLKANMRLSSTKTPWGGKQNDSNGKEKETSKDSDDSDYTSSYSVSSEENEDVRQSEDWGDDIDIEAKENLQSFKLRSFAVVDEDQDLGGQWLLNKESKNSIDCKGAFPFGTGRTMNYLRAPPPLSKQQLNGLDASTKEQRRQYASKMERMMSRLPDDMVPISEWGPRAIWTIGGSDRVFKSGRQGRRVLFTWGNTAYPTHPRLARGVFRDRVKGFQTRETNLGWSPTFGSLSLQPKAVILHSPINPLS